jgi:transaldolase
VKLILISADLEDIRKAYTLGVFVGVASNPSLVAEAGVPSEEMVRRVLKIVPDPVFVQVSELAAEGMIEEGQRLAAIDPQRVRVKVPVTAAGITAIHSLAEAEVTVTATAICAANEALLAAQAGAAYLAPYMARIYDIGGNGCQVVGDIVELVRDHDLPSKVIAASVRTPEELMLAWKLGADYAAIQSPVVWKICANPAVDAAAQTFHADYAARFGASEERAAQ